MRMWTGFNGLKTRFRAGACEQGKELSGAVKDRIPLPAQSTITFSGRTLLRVRYWEISTF
jgi:hypothetical protein